MPRSEQRRRSAFDAPAPPEVSHFGDAGIELVFDYSVVDDVHRDLVKAAARAIKPRLKRAAEDIFVIGRELMGVREFLPYGSYVDWLDVEFSLSVRQAYRFISVAERLSGKSFDIMSKLPPTTLYMLAAPSTPDLAIEAIEAKVIAGEPVRVSTVRQAIAQARREDEQDIAGEDIAKDERVAASKKLAQLLDQAMALLDDTLLLETEIASVQPALNQLRQTLLERIA